jgi:hypothetical protein
MVKPLQGNIHGPSQRGHLEQFINSSRSHDWLTHSDLGLEGDMASEWDSYILMLICNGVSLSNEADTISWTWNKASGVVTVKSAYEALVEQHVKEEPEWWFNAI